jgi:hypothetical protein
MAPARLVRSPSAPPTHSLCLSPYIVSPTTSSAPTPLCFDGSYRSSQLQPCLAWPCSDLILFHTLLLCIPPCSFLSTFPAIPRFVELPRSDATTPTSVPSITPPTPITSVIPYHTLFQRSYSPVSRPTRQPTKQLTKRVDLHGLPPASRWSTRDTRLTLASADPLSSQNRLVVRGGPADPFSSDCENPAIDR